MNPNVRAGLFLLGFIGLAVMVIVACGLLWWSQHGNAWMDGGDDGLKQGEAFGKQADQLACVDALFERHRQQAYAPPSMGGMTFLISCLRAAEPSAALCKDVPSTWNAFASQQWREQRCAQAGAPGAACAGSLVALVQHCERAGDVDQR